MVIIIQYKMTDIKTEYDRLKFKSYYNDAIIDVLTLKKECNCTVDEISKTTPYEIDFINFVIENYDVESEEKYIYLKINKDNIDVKKLKGLGYNDALIQEMLNPEEEGTSYYQPK